MFDNKTVLQMKNNINAISLIYQTDDALTLNTNPNISAPKW